MVKNWLLTIGGIGILCGSIVFAFEPIINNQFNIPWIYNPISGFYEQRNKEDIEKEKISNMDFYSDTSLQKFLDDKHPLGKAYEANDIVTINSDFTSNKSSDFKLRKEAAKMFEGMAWAFSNAFEFKVKLTLNSAWRSQKYQRQLASNCSVGRCALPGTSEHEAGLALDLGVNGGNIKMGSGIYYQRLMDNAHKYGFHNSYQKGMDVDGKIVEPWHWRYVGKELAAILHDNNMTFSEYFYQNIEPKN